MTWAASRAPAILSAPAGLDGNPVGVGFGRVQTLNNWGFGRCHWPVRRRVWLAFQDSDEGSTRRVVGKWGLRSMAVLHA